MAYTRCTLAIWPDWPGTLSRLDRAESVREDLTLRRDAVHICRYVRATVCAYKRESYCIRPPPSLERPRAKKPHDYKIRSVKTKHV